MLQYQISPRTLFSYVKALKVQALFHSSLNEMKAWILYEFDLLHAILCRERGYWFADKLWEISNISVCKKYSTNILLPSLISPSSLMSKQDLSVAFFGKLPGNYSTYSFFIRDSSCKHSSHRANPDSSSSLSTDVAQPIPFMTALFCSWAWSTPINESFLFDFCKAK